MRSLLGYLSILTILTLGCNDAGLKTASFTDVNFIARFKDDKPAAVSFTFDDGLRSAIDTVAPMFESFSWRTTFFINSTPWYTEWKIMAENGHEIANHSFQHIHLIRIPDKETLEFEINHNYEMIENNIGIAPLSFAHTYDVTNDLIDSVVFEKHLFSRISPPRFCHPIEYNFATKLNQANSYIDDAIKSSDWIVPAMHGIEDGSYPIKKDFLRQHLEYIKSKESEIWVDTFKNIALYKLERENSSLTLVADNKKVYINLAVNLDLSIGWVPLTVLMPIDFEYSNIQLINNQSSANVDFTIENNVIKFDIAPGEELLLSWD